MFMLKLIAFNNNNNNNNTQREYKTRHDWVGKVIYLEMCK